MKSDLNTKGTLVTIVCSESKTEKELNIVYESVTDNKSVLDGIISSYLTGYSVNSTLELGVYKCMCLIKITT